MIVQYVSSHVKEIVLMSTVIVLLVFTLMGSPSIHVFPKTLERTSIGRPSNCQKEIDDFVPLMDFMSQNSSWHEARFQQVMKRESLVPGGRYVPEKCGRVSKFRTLILVPYRDRESNLIRFLSYMHSFLQRQDIEYQIFIISQAMSPFVPFNRGALFNIGFQLAMNRSNSSWDCVIYHDVDHLPENEDNIYTCWDVPRHLNSNDNNIGRLLYSKYFGGVSAMKPAQYIQINGYSNRFFGWGGEDDDVQKRITIIGLEWRHVDLKTGSRNFGDMKSRINQGCGEVHEFVVNGIIKAMDVVAPRKAPKVMQGANLYLLTKTLALMKKQDCTNAAYYKMLRNKVLHIGP